MRCSVVFGVTSRLLVINISSSSPTINTAAYCQRCVITCETVRRWPSSIGDHVDNTWHVVALTAGIKARYRLIIAISAYPTCIRRPCKGPFIATQLNSTSSWIELRRRSVYSDADATELDVELSWVELRRYKRAFRGFPSDYCYFVWRGKTRMMDLPDGEKIMMICLLVLTQFTNVTDTQTDTQTPHDGKGRAWC